LVFGRLTSLSGTFGFVVVFYVIFLVTYGFSCRSPRIVPAVLDRVMGVMLTAAAVLALFALFLGDRVSPSGGGRLRRPIASWRVGPAEPGFDVVEDRHAEELQVDRPSHLQRPVHARGVVLPRRPTTSR